VTYICFVESSIVSVPHMEPLSAMTAEEARDEARRLLRQHASGVAAHVFAGEERIHSIRADELEGA
jgi:hypothetical protein